MARQRTQAQAMTPDALDDDFTEATEQESPAVAVETKSAVVAVDRMVIIEIPLMTQDPGGYTSIHLNTQLSPRQADALKRLTRAAHDRHEKLLPTDAYPSGRHVDTPTDAIRWLLEQVAGAV
jgi:hypothetical protein